MVIMEIVKPTLLNNFLLHFIHYTFLQCVDFEEGGKMHNEFLVL